MENIFAWWRQADENWFDFLRQKEARRAELRNALDVGMKHWSH